MASKNTDTPSDGQPADYLDYQRAFYHQSLLLLICGYQKLISTGIDCSGREETEITGELVRHTNNFIDDVTSPEWAIPFEVKEESPENTKGRLGKGRKRVDVVCVLTQRRPRLRLKFEAKRLKNKLHPVGIYLGKEGLQEFLNENYAPEAGAVGMLGYIQSDNCDYWRDQISNELKKNGTDLSKAAFEQVDNCYRSIHKRYESKREILIFHLLLDFAILSRQRHLRAAGCLQNERG